MAKILLGKPVADAICEKLTARIGELKDAEITPTLAIVRVGERADDLSYERGVEKRFQALGIELKKFILPNKCSQTELLDTITQVNNDPHIHGCLMFRPLPKTLDEQAICNALSPVKDMDGITPGSLYGVFTGDKKGYPPCTAHACIKMLDFYGYDLDGANVVVIGRSLVVGKPVSMMLQAKNATVTMCHTHTRNLDKVCKRADILVVAAGHAKVIGPNATHSEQVILDVGINWDECENKLVGDVNFDEVEPLTGAITPVPRGVGSVTSAVLASHVVRACEKSIKCGAKN